MASKQSFDIIKIKENMGIKPWILQNCEFIRESFQKTFSALIILCYDDKFLLLDSIGNAPIYFQKQSNSSCCQCDIIVVFVQNNIEINIEEVINYIKLQRIFKNNYLFSLKYFPCYLLNELKDYGIYNLDGFYNTQSEQGYSQNSSLFEKLSEIQYNFDQYTLFEEQNYITTLLSKKEISEIISSVFQIEGFLISEQIQTSLGNVLSIYSGIQESISEQQAYFYFFEDGQLIIREDIQQIQQDIMNILLGEIEGVHFSQLKEMKSRLGIQKKLQQKKGIKQYYNYLFIINLGQNDILEDQNQNNWIEALQVIDSMIKKTQIFKQLSIDLNQANNQYKVNNIIQNEIPMVVNLMSEISEILNEPIQPDESQILSSCLSKIFILNLI